MLKRSIHSVLFLSFFLAACSEKDSICACIEAGDKLNEKSNEILRKEPTAADEAAILKLRKTKKTKCAEFVNMAGPEMLERKASCAE